MDRGAWQATVYGVTKSWTRLSDRAHFVFGHILKILCNHYIFMVKINIFQSHLSEILV